MKKLIYLFFALWYFQASGCHCSYPILAENYQSSGYVALVKILKATPDPENSTYLNVEIELLNLYKGKATPTLRINTMVNTSCAFKLPEGSTWLVFAKLDQNGIPGFGPCSGSQQLDPYPYDSVQHPKAANNYKKSMHLKLETLSFLKNNNLEASKSNSHDLALFPLGGCDDSLKGFENQNRFAVYEVDINEDLSVAKITARQEFDNAELAQRLLECLRENARIYAARSKEIPAETKLLVIYYYYPAEGNDPSFVGKFDL